MILKIVIIAIICVFVSSTLKHSNTEFANVINISGGVLIFILVCEELTSIVDFVLTSYSNLYVNEEVIKALIKVVGIGYITEFTADVAEDFGNKVIASKVLLGGKVVVCGMTIPIIKELLIMLSALLS